MKHNKPPATKAFPDYVKGNLSDFRDILKYDLAEDGPGGSAGYVQGATGCGQAEGQTTAAVVEV
jgi:hypothetical protein